MSRITNITLSLSEPDLRELKKFLIQLGVKIEKTPAGFQARHGDAIINWYQTGKLLLQGKDAADLAEELYLMGLVKTGWTLKSEPRIGVDESGKGDYFGPLVTAGAVVDPEKEPQLIRLGIRDSKSISDYTIKQMSAELIKIVPYSTVVIGPKKYNQLHLKMNNVNRILAWAHSRAIENLLAQHPVKLAVSDQFGDESLIRNALMRKGKEIKLVQRHRGEEDLAVACASVIARSEFLARLDQLSRQFGMELPKGASDLVIDAGKRLVKKSGIDALEQTAKTHFKTTSKILA